MLVNRSILYGYSSSNQSRVSFIMIITIIIIIKICYAWVSKSFIEGSTWFQSCDIPKLRSNFKTSFFVGSIASHPCLSVATGGGIEPL